MTRIARPFRRRRGTIAPRRRNAFCPVPTATNLESGLLSRIGHLHHSLSREPGLPEPHHVARAHRQEQVAGLEEALEPLRNSFLVSDIDQVPMPRLAPRAHDELPGDAG